MSRRCLICSDINPCRHHSEAEQAGELRRNDADIARIRAEAAERTPPPKQGDVEKVARIVDPYNWARFDRRHQPEKYKPWIDASLAKAREIIAALKASPPPALEAGDLERLAGIRRKLVFHHCEGLAHDIACLARFEGLAGTVEE